jgi:predicted RNase H-like HicB family nuclease
MTTSIILHNYRIVFDDDAKLTNGESCVMAEHPDLPGCFAYGKNRSEAESRLAEARGLYLKSMIDAGEQIPEPTVTGVDWPSAELLYPEAEVEYEEAPRQRATAR